MQSNKLKARLQTIDTMLRETLKIVKGLDEQILELCETTNISKEVEEARCHISSIGYAAFKCRKSNEISVNGEK